MAQGPEAKGFFSIVYDGWLLFAEIVGRFNTKIIVGLIYFLLVSLAWIFTSTCLKRQLLDRAFRISAKSAWKERGEAEKTINIEKLRHQF